jgi:hypothetical protein
MGQGSAKEEPAPGLAQEDKEVSHMTAVPPTRAFFAASKRFAVVGASADRAKFGNKILRAYQGAGLVVTVRVLPRGRPRRDGCFCHFLT